MLSWNNVYKSYWGANRALDSVSLSVGPGEIVGLFGANGAGKTTLLKCALGLLRYTGSVTLDGEPITHRNIARLSFATCEHSFFPALTPAAHREFYREHFPTFREKRFDALMDFFALPLHRRARGFSTGQKNQLEVTLALSQGADYILMDEPFAGNDVFNREDFYRLLLGLLEPGETIVLSTHLLEEVQHFISRAVLLDRGTIAGDVTTGALEERGESLMDFVKSSLHYRGDRVLKTLEGLDDGEGE
ncbi:ATP-binding cassette domain-containing protein [Flavonifractor sp.]|uniref:ATP-binding cassette domain-containing protein n=1 Tax=Flavonifractor sp. TaxID=2049025 RepID=UPI0025BDD5BB|nr:ABC transporter ATP-binding protein [Flavonifractor sp.]